jgi:TRAP transporter TAXI family solute receptor
MKLRASVLACVTAFQPLQNACAAEPGWPQSIAIATASPGGTYYVYGQALADILGKELGIEVTAQATQGSTRNVILVETGHAALGLITMGTGWEAWNGAGEWTKGQRFRAMRAILPMYDSPFHIAVAKRLGVKLLEEATGKRLGTGARGGTSGIYFPRIFETLGIPAVLSYGSIEETTSQISAGQLDGIVLATGVPVPALFKLDQEEGMQYVPFTADQVKILRQQMPELTDSTIANGAYPSLTVDYHTVGLFNFVVANKDLPEDLVYRIVKAVFDKHAQLVKAHSAAGETISANINRDTFLPIHPGALRYYREIGIDVPAVLAGDR